MTATMMRAPVPLAPGGSLLDEGLAGTLAELDASAKYYAQAIHDQSLGHLQRAIVTARAINLLRASITDEIMEEIYSLCGSPLGFRADRPTKKYPPYTRDEVKEVFVLSLLNGLYPVGNEWNIIAGGLMIVQNGWARKVREIPGLTNLETYPGVPRLVDGCWQIRFGASWQLGGQRQELRDAKGEPGRAYIIPSYDGTGPDAIVGKGLRRCYKSVYEMVTGSDWLIGVDEEPAVPAAKPTPAAASKTAALADRLEGVPANGTMPPAAEDLEREDAERRILDAVGQASTTQDLERSVGVELRQLREWIGDERHARLLAAYQVRYRTLAAGGKRGGV